MTTLTKDSANILINDFVDAVTGVTQSFKSKNLSAYISADEVKNMGLELNKPVPEINIVQSKLAEMQNKMAAELGSDKADALLKDVYGKNFDYKAKVGELPEKEFDFQEKGGELLDWVGENKKTSLLVALCGVAGAGFVKNLFSGKAGIGGTLIGIAMAVGLFAMAETAIGMANQKGAPERDNEEKRENGIPGNQVPFNHNRAPIGPSVASR